MRRVKARVVIVAALGLALALYFIGFVGVGAVFSAAGTVGWGGFAILCLYYLGLFPLLGTACWVLLPGRSHLRVRVFVWARMVRDAATDVLPFSQLGGLALGARAAILEGVRRPLAFASLIVDVTAEMLAQIAYIACGLAILSVRVPRTSAAASLTAICIIGLALAMAAGALFLAVQRYGHRLIGRFAMRFLPAAVGATAEVGETLDAIYRTPLRVALSAALHFGGWITSAVGAWIAFRLIGAHVDLASVVAIESLVGAVRSAFEGRQQASNQIVSRCGPQFLHRDAGANHVLPAQCGKPHSLAQPLNFGNGLNVLRQP